MTIYLPKYKLTYVSVPKCACTSLKELFFHIENGFSYRNFKLNGADFYVHQFAPSIPFAELRPGKMEGHRKIAVVRDPVSRVVSCYSNKVLGERALERPKPASVLSEMGVTLTPTLSEFVRDLPVYQKAAPYIDHHSKPLSYFLGRDPGFFDRLFALRDLPDMIAYINAAVGEVPDLPHVHRTASSSMADDLTPEDRRRLEQLFAEDLELFGAFM